VTPDGKHLLGGILMWGGLGPLAFGLMVLMPSLPLVGLLVGTVGVLSSLAGVYLKKKNCPKC